MKNSTLILLVLILFPFWGHAQISHGGQPYSFNHTVSDGKIPIEVMPFIDIAALQAEDALVGKGEAFRFGKEVGVQLSLNNTGKWETLVNGDRLWRLQIFSKNALTISLVYDKFYMPSGAKLHLYNPDHSSTLGAFNEANNKPHGKFSTGFVKGSNTIVEYYEPAEVAGQGALSIAKVVHGYRSIYDLEKQFGDSGACNINVNAPEGADWQDQKRAVAMILDGGMRACTGTMINNTREDCVPFFLTAEHCLGPAGDEETWLFMFNYESPGTANVDGPTDQLVSGATLRANSPISDFALLELSVAPPPDYNVFYAGWNREDEPANATVCIHHPSGDIKKITINNDPVVSAIGLGAPNDTHWEVTEWENGTTEGGSSGAAMFDLNGRIVGQLQGGSAACGNMGFDTFGKLAVSWSKGATLATRINTWLDPFDTGVSVLDGRNCTATQITLDAAAFLFTAPPVFACGEQVTVPEVLIYNNGVQTLLSAEILMQLDSETPIVVNWTGTLGMGESEVITLPDFTAGIGEHTLLITLQNPNGSADNNPSNNQVSYNFEATTGAFPYLELVTDNWGNETTIQITDTVGEIVFSDGPFSSNENIVIDFCLSAGCYDFTIFDSYGDGLCCSGGMGSYSLFYQNGDLVSTGGEFGFEETTNFCVGAVGIDGSQATLGIQIGPNPSSDFLQVFNPLPSDEKVTLQIFNVTGKQLATFDVQAGNNILPIHNIGLPSGVYCSVITAGAKKQVDKLVFIQQN